MAERWILPSMVFVILSLQSMLVTAASVPAIFILGDSTADVGTNNYLPTFAKANFLYNGIDFPGGPNPTGRFSNGLNSADTLSRHMGFKRSPPSYLGLLSNKNNLTLGKHIQLGANFASGASGLIDTTGAPFGKVSSMGEQCEHFSAVAEVLKGLWGETATKSFLCKSLFIISVGSNDIFEFYATNSTSNKQDYVNYLISIYGTHIRRLYFLGARKFGLISVPAIGCCPAKRALNTTLGGGCLEDLNEYSRLFYSSLQTLMPQISNDLEDIKYSIGNTYEMVTNFMENPLPFGFTELKSACCGNGTFNGEAPCTKDAKLCSNRKEYLFWDMFHPTQAASELAALTLYGGENKFVTPINFRELAEA